MTLFLETQATICIVVIHPDCSPPSTPSLDLSPGNSASAPAFPELKPSGDKPLDPPVAHPEETQIVRDSSQTAPTSVKILHSGIPDGGSLFTKTSGNSHELRYRHCGFVNLGAGRVETVTCNRPPSTGQ